jgi:DNA-binding FadR family transcriptional regulator
VNPPRRLLRVYFNLAPEHALDFVAAVVRSRSPQAVWSTKILSGSHESGRRDDQPHDQTTEDDIDFHLAIAEASGNALFNQIVASFVPLMRVAVPQAWKTRQTDDEKADILARHRNLAWAIANHDPEEAERCMGMHFDETIGALLR